MSDWWSLFMDLVTSDGALRVMRAVIIVTAGLILARILRRALTRLFSKQLSSHQLMLLRQASFYFVFGLFLISALWELGFNLGVLLGAAGVLSVAVGFASQTSASNLISGLFLLGEKPFSVGDVIRVADTTGEVLSIDLLSVKLRTYDNLYVRIPNETLIKSEVTTLTKFPIRRIDLEIGVAYKEDIGKVRDVLLAVAEHNPLCLEEPKPLFIFLGFGDSALNLQFSVWVKRENLIPLKNSIHEQIKTAFDAAGIEIPFPHRSLYAGSVTEPFPVRVVGSAPGTEEPR